MLRIAALTLSLAGIAASAPADPQTIIAEQVPAARTILDAWRGQDPPTAERKLHLVYWTPSDRQPAPRYRERLSAIMTDIRAFYAAEMKRLGFGPLTIGLQETEDDWLKIHLVKGRQPYRHYNVKSGGEIRTECLPTLTAAGLNPDKETIVIFCNMSNWDADKKTISQNSPYYAGGTHRNGTAWQVDSPVLDLALLDQNQPRVRDGQYGHITVGRYNSIFIGGVAHELGHAIGMPHNRQTPAEGAAWGTALMGSGNRTYGEDRRNEGKGSFLTLAHGLRLASHPMFCGVVKDIDTRPNYQITGVSLTPGNKAFQLTAKVAGTPPVYAVLGYMDPQGGGDYDATTCSAIPAADGSFTLNCDALAPGKAATLRLVTLHANGAASSFVGSNARYSFPYSVARDGTPDLTTARAGMVLRPLIDALERRSGPDIEAAITQLEQAKAEPLLIETARSLAATIGGAERIDPAATELSPLPLSDARWSQARVGWGRPTANRLPDPNPLFIAGSRLFPRGIYAHAPSNYSYRLDAKWKSLTGHAGIADGHRGTVSFRITGDGRELWRSPLVKPGQLLPFELSLENIKELTLETTDAGDGNGSDWALWLDPVLR